MKKREFMRGLNRTIKFLEKVREEARLVPASKINGYEIFLSALTPSEAIVMSTKCENKNNKNYETD